KAGIVGVRHVPLGRDRLARMSRPDVVVHHIVLADVELPRAAPREGIRTGPDVAATIAPLFEVRKDSQTAVTDTVAGRIASGAIPGGAVGGGADDVASSRIGEEAVIVGGIHLEGGP